MRCPPGAGSARGAGPPPAREAFGLQNDAGIADALIALDQVDLLGDYFPLAIDLSEAVAGPAAQEAGLVAPELMDQEIGPHHADVVVVGGKHLHVGDEPDG